jgi:hypothetical protein
LISAQIAQSVLNQRFHAFIKVKIDDRLFELVLSR